LDGLEELKADSWIDSDYFRGRLISLIDSIAKE